MDAMDFEQEDQEKNRANMMALRGRSRSNIYNERKIENERSICVICGGRIHRKRVEALIQIKTCIDCANEDEKNFQ